VGASAKLKPVAVIAVAEMFGMSGRRDEHTTLLERFERCAVRKPGCRRYRRAAAVADPARHWLVTHSATVSHRSSSQEPAKLEVSRVDD
jgi:hypothetical protein